MLALAADRPQLSLVGALAVLGLVLGFHAVRMEEERLAGTHLMICLGITAAAVAGFFWPLPGPSGLSTWLAAGMALFGLSVILYAVRMNERDRRQLAALPRGQAVASDWGISRALARRLPLNAFRAVQVAAGIGIIGLGVAAFLFE